jgi:hypothetical protein
MSPELVSLYGTSTWEALDDRSRRRLALLDVANLFSLTLHGERPLVQGLCDQMYSRQDDVVTRYMHHFVDEENKHMMLFSDFCHRYVGKVYPYKKLALPRDHAPREEDVRFFVRALIVEELGLYYNAALAVDERVHDVVRAINRLHRTDESRHVAFGWRVLAELVPEVAPRWPEGTLAGLREWVAAYLRHCWADYYNVEVYADAGLPDPLALRKQALAAGREHRRLASRKVVDGLLRLGLLAAEPAP